jgi:hypothetical protein
MGKEATLNPVTEGMQPVDNAFELDDVVKDGDYLAFIMDSSDKAKAKQALMTDKQYNELEEKAMKQLKGETQTLLEKLSLIPPSRERSIAYTNIQQAGMWMQADLNRIEAVKEAKEV